MELPSFSSFRYEYRDTSAPKCAGHSEVPDRSGGQKVILPFRKDLKTSSSIDKNLSTELECGGF